MLGSLLNQVIPASLYGGETALSALTKIAGEVRQCRGTREAAVLLENSKAGLFALLRRHFDEPVAQALTLKILNLFLARYHFEARSASVLSRPFGLVVAATSATHCTRCEWDHTTVNIGGPEIRRYFRAADAAFFDRQSLRILSDW